MSRIKLWKQYLLFFWNNYGKGEILVKNIREQKGNKGASWLNRLWRWELMKRVRPGVYCISQNGINKINYYFGDKSDDDDVGLF